MKGIIFIAVSLLTLASCEKKKCYHCIEKYKPASLYNIPFTDKDLGEFCGWTESDKDRYVKANSFTGSSTMGYPAMRMVVCSEK